MADNKYIITDWQISAGDNLKHHMVALCLLLALSASDSLILELLPGLTPGQFAMLKSNRIVTKKQQEYRELFLGENASEQFQRHMPKAFAIMEEVLNAPPEEMKLKDRFEAARWLFEKVTGRAKQELELSGGVTVLSLLNALDAMKAEVADSGTGGAILPSARGRDVTPKDPLAEWVALNVPKST